MGRRPTRIVVGSDWHIGNIAGLIPQKYNPKSEDPIELAAHLYRKTLWKFHIESLKSLWPIDHFVANGDIIDGTSQVDQSLFESLSFEDLRPFRKLKFYSFTWNLGSIARVGVLHDGDFNVSVFVPVCLHSTLLINPHFFLLCHSVRNRSVHIFANSCKKATTHFSKSLRPSTVKYSLAM